MFARVIQIEMFVQSLLQVVTNFSIITLADFVDARLPQFGHSPSRLICVSVSRHFAIMARQREKRVGRGRA